ncbi:MAG: carboxypeptidase regulatory-like domain-containing protein, partial [Acidobacteria bacterium]|nr:carboxypeptidase regulatory-like domain-containing protein [Acidobacteriota bacterium]
MILRRTMHYLLATAMILAFASSAWAAVTLRTVTGTIRKLDGSLWAGARVVFRLEKFTYTATDQFPPGEVSAITDSNGAFSIVLWTNAEGLKPVKYRYIPPGTESFLIIIPAGDPITINALLASSGVEPTPSNQALLQSLIDGHEAEADPHPSYLTQPEGNA